MALTRMDNVGIVVESLDTTIAFFVELGMRLEGRATIDGEWAGRVTGLGLQHVEIAMLVTPDGHSRLELSRFLTPLAISATLAYCDEEQHTLDPSHRVVSHAVPKHTQKAPLGVLAPRP
jgi:catechol 2,3-dioxygenase-like lactoylglutathione lyase family enzyme